MLPMVREAAERIVLTLPREDICAHIVNTPSLKVFDDRQPNGTNGFTFLTVLQPQAARLGVRLRPFQDDYFAPPAAGQRKLANDVNDHGVFLLLGGVAEHPTQYSILRLREPTLSHIVLWLADAMGRVALDNPCFVGVGKDATKKTHGACGRSCTPLDDCFAAQLFGLDRNPRLSGHNVLEDLVDIGLGEILDPPCPYERNNVALNTTGVG